MGIPHLGPHRGSTFQEAWQRLRHELPELPPLDIANLLSPGDRFVASDTQRLVKLGGDETIWRGVFTPLEDAE